MPDIRHLPMADAVDPALIDRPNTDTIRVDGYCFKAAFQGTRTTGPLLASRRETAQRKSR